MKKILFFLLTIAVALSAVEWEIEQVTVGENQWNDWPVIALDDQGNPGSAYIQYGEAEDSLMYASNAAGSWIIEGISHLYGWYSLDYDSDGNAYIVYSNNDVGWESPMDIYLATDTGGLFEANILVEDTGDLDVPRIKLDDEDNIHFIYVHRTDGAYENLFYGLVNDAGTFIEWVTNSLKNSWHVDFTFDLDDRPHIFYDGPEGLWHAYQSSPDWVHERIYQYADFPSLSMDYISAATDKQGNFHIACNPGESIILYLTNKTGSWVEEVVSDTTDEDLWPIYSSIALDPNGYPHITWAVYNDIEEWMEIFYAGKTTGSWAREQLTFTSLDEKTPDERHFFAIDPDGYGHLIYADWRYGDEDDTGYVYYAKSTEPLIGGITEHPVVANPFNMKILGSSVYFSLQETTSLRLSLYDVAGRRVRCIASGYYPAGEHQIPFNTSELSSGVYFVRAETGRQSASVKFVQTR